MQYKFFSNLSFLQKNLICWYKIKSFIFFFINWNSTKILLTINFLTVFKNIQKPKILKKLIFYKKNRLNIKKINFNKLVALTQKKNNSKIHFSYLLNYKFQTSNNFFEKISEKFQYSKFPLVGFKISPFNSFFLKKKFKLNPLLFKFFLKTNWKYFKMTKIKPVTFTNSLQFLKYVKRLKSVQLLKLLKPLKYFKYLKSKNFLKKIKKFKNLKYLKTFYYTNILFFNKLKLNYKNLKFIVKYIKIPYEKSQNNHKFSRPYMFLQSKKIFIKKAFFPLKYVYQHFKAQKKLFRLLKKKKWLKKKIFKLFKKLTYSTINKMQQSLFARKLKHKIIKKKKVPYLFLINTKFKFYNNNDFINYYIDKNLIFDKYILIKFYSKLIKIFKLSSYFLKNKKIIFKFNKRHKLWKITKVFRRMRHRYIRLSRFFKRYKKIWQSLVLVSILCEYKPVFLLTNIDFIYSTYLINSILKKKNLVFLLYNKKIYFSFKINNSRINLFNSKKLFVQSFLFNCFILHLTGFLLLTNTLIVNFFAKNFQSMHKLNQILYSFTFKEDLTYDILKRYSKYRANFDLISYFQKKKLLKNESTGYLLPQFSFSDMSSEINLNKPLSNLQTVILNYTSSNLMPHFLDKNFPIKPFIKKVKFKPGYMRYWRNAREALVILLKTPPLYQHKLTSFLIQFKKTFILNSLIFFEMQLFKILIRAKLVLDSFYARTYIESGLVFINGLCCKIFNFQLFQNDLIQLIISFKYYITFRWILNNTYKIKNKIKFVSWKIKKKKKNPNISNLGNPLFILDYKFSISDIARYLEVDFFTLSTFILYDPILVNDINLYDINSVRYQIFNMYNWKYIT